MKITDIVKKWQKRGFNVQRFNYFIPNKFLYWDLDGTSEKDVNWCNKRDQERRSGDGTGTTIRQLQCQHQHNPLSLFQYLFCLPCLSYFLGNLVAIPPQLSRRECESNESIFPFLLYVFIVYIVNNTVIDCCFGKVKIKKLIRYLGSHLNLKFT